MRLEWIEDLLAVLDTGSLARAAERRFVTQSAFTRRVRMIETSIGATLFDRSRKPITLMPGVAALEPELRDLAARLRRVTQDLRLSATDAGRPIVFACQHAITTTAAPRVVSELASAGEASVRIRSGNQDECLMLLLSGAADFAMMYDLPGAPSPAIPQAFEAVAVGADTLIPVVAPGVQPSLQQLELPIISYPPDVFLGQVFNRRIAPRLPGDVQTASRAETALTLAMLQLALNGAGIAWLPRSLVTEHLSQGRLVSAEARLPIQELEIKLIRPSVDASERSRAVWPQLIEMLRRPPG